MKIAIIGGGFTGLAASFELLKAGHSITIVEREPFLGGLAYGFKESQWQWHIEAAYHHLFTNDAHILGLIDEMGLSDQVITKRPITATLWQNRMFQLDSPMSLFSFPGLSFIDKIRTAITIGLLKATPLWKPLEAITAEGMLKIIGGSGAWNTLWEPLLYGKFGALAPTIAASWFWARIKKRTSHLVYIKGGFHTLVTALEIAIKKGGGTIQTNTQVESITKKPNGSFTITWSKKTASFDAVLITTPTPIAIRLFPSLPPSYTSGLLSIPHLFAQTLILETDIPILQNVYWLNVTDRAFPFLAAVAHTNFMSPTHYGNRHLTYFGNYLPKNHHYLSMTKEQLLKKFMPYIKKISNAKFRITNSFSFVGPFAQPVHELYYSRKIPPIKTPIPGLYMANMDFVFPWDRGTNYAVELGQRAARIIHENG